MLSKYNRCKWDWLAAQEQRKLALGCENEVGPLKQPRVLSHPA